MLWVAEYSFSQDAFHMQPLADALRANLRRVLVKDASCDWVPFACGEEFEVRRVLAEVHAAQARLKVGKS